jgi:hypothetical protein
VQLLQQALQLVATQLQELSQGTLPSDPCQRQHLASTAAAYSHPAAAAGEQQTGGDPDAAAAAAGGCSSETQGFVVSGAEGWVQGSCLLELQELQRQHDVVPEVRSA